MALKTISNSICLYTLLTLSSLNLHAAVTCHSLFVSESERLIQAVRQATSLAKAADHTKLYSVVSTAELQLSPDQMQNVPGALRAYINEGGLVKGEGKNKPVIVSLNKGRSAIYDPSFRANFAISTVGGSQTIVLPNGVFSSHNLRNMNTDYFKPVAALLRQGETYLASIGVPSHIYVPREKIIDPGEQWTVSQIIPGSKSVHMAADSKDFLNYAALVAEKGVVKVRMAIDQQVLFSVHPTTGRVTVITLSTSADTTVLQNWHLSDLLNYAQQSESNSRKNWWW